MKQGSTLFLKLAILLFGGLVFLLCFFLVKTLLTEDVGRYGLILAGMLVAAVPFFIGAYETFKLLNYVDQKKAYSLASVKSLNTIKYCGIVISALYGLGMPYIFVVAEQDDAPGVVMLGLIFTFAPLVVAVIAAVLQRLLQNALTLKFENDLTV